MQTVILIAESCIHNEIGYMDLTAKTVGKELVVSAEDHDGYTWEAKCDIEAAFSKLAKSIGLNRAKEILSNMESLVNSY